MVLTARLQGRFTSIFFANAYFVKALDPAILLKGRKAKALAIMVRKSTICIVGDEDILEFHVTNQQRRGVTSSTNKERPKKKPNEATAPCILPVHPAQNDPPNPGVRNPEFPVVIDTSDFKFQVWSTSCVKIKQNTASFGRIH